MVDELDRRRFLKQTAVAAGATLAPRLARAQVPSDRPVIGQGLQIGDVLPGSAIVWSRSDRPARMLVEWATTDGFKHAFRVRGPHALEVTNYTARIDLTDLPEDQDIFVRVRFQNLDAGKAESDPVAADAALPQAQNAAGESAIGDLIADAQREATGADFTFMNPGGIRASLDAGPITWGELFIIQPFGNSLVTMNMTGAQIYAVLEQQWAGQPFARIMQISGFEYTWDPAKPVGSRVLEVRQAGAALDKTATYKVSCNNFMATGGDNFTVFTQGTNQVGGAIDLDALVDYVEDHSPIAGGIAGRIKNP